jgi:hypothetical protein
MPDLDYNEQDNQQNKEECTGGRRVFARRFLACAADGG